jgi:hypothetical protein
MFLSAASPMAIQGAEEYGTTVYPSEFDPPCNGYEFVNSDSDDGVISTYFNAKSTSGAEHLDSIFHSAAIPASDFPMQFFVNATNQPSFADGKICDEYVRYFDTPLSQGHHAPVPVRGDVSAKMNLFSKPMSWSGAIGMRLDTAFLENHLVSCQSLAGYRGRGEQEVALKESEELVRHEDLK